MADTVIITGTTRGLGEILAQRFRNSGWHVQSIHGDGDMTDVTDHAQVMSRVAEIYANCGNVQALVNCAGSFQDGVIHRLTPESWGSVIATNLTGPFNVLSAVLPRMRTAKYGRIVNLSSVQGQVGVIGAGNYASAKAGLVGLTKSVALESAKFDITCNAVALGFIDVGMFRRLPAELRDGIISRIPKGRPGTADEVFHTVQFLCDKRQGYITGTTIDLNGGYYTR